jgi:hypothetical protein
VSLTDDSVEGIRGRFDLVEGLELGAFGREGYQSMLAQMGRTVSRPFYGSNAILLRPFTINLPETRLLEMMGAKRSHASLHEEAGRLVGYSGMAARDGSESYALSRVDLLFEEYSNPPGRDPISPGCFMFYLDIRVGGPIPETFIQSSPSDRSGERFWASLQVVWEKVWSFFVAPTKPFALELRERVLAAHGFDIGPPPYTVSGGG